MKREYLCRRKGTCLLIGALTLLTLTFTGCDAQEEEQPITENTVVVTEDGKLISYMIDTFDKDYYSVEELAVMAKQEADQFSRDYDIVEEGQEMVISGAELMENGKQVSLIIEFANAESYGTYYGVNAYYGSVAGALEAGWSLSGKLIDVNNEKTISDEKLEKYGEDMILILGDDVEIRMPGKIRAQGEVSGLKYIMLK